MQFSDDEEKLLSWLKANYLNLIFGLVIGASIVLGYNYFQSSALAQQHEISLIYQKSIKNYKNGEFDIFMENVENLKAKHPSNVYTAMINLYTSKYYHDKDMLDEAKKYLSHIVDNSDSDQFKFIANTRLARINLSQKKYEDALRNLANTNTTNNPIVLDITGDVMLATGNKIEAIKNYELAIRFETIPNKSKLIESKLSTIR